MNILKERLKVGLAVNPVIFRDDVLGRPLHPPTATGGDHLASGFDAQDDESVLTGELVLVQQLATAARLLLLVGRRGGDERRPLRTSWRRSTSRVGVRHWVRLRKEVYRRHTAHLW
jgi:hypothetical protein